MKTKVFQKLFVIVAATATVLIQSSMVYAQYDTTAFPRIEKPIYFGYEIGVGAEFQNLTSDIPQLQHLALHMEGATVGIKLANTRGAIRAMGGLFYSGGNVPRTIDMLKGGVSGNLYLLRLKEVVYRTFEPYALVSLTYQQTKFYGTYLHDDNRKKNNSMSEEPELGKVHSATTSLGAGVEFQLENDRYQFIHFFAEGKYSTPIFTKGSNNDFSQTQINTPFTLSIGMSFGKFK